MNGTPAKSLEFYYEFASTYSYLSAMRIETLAARSGDRAREGFGDLWGA